MKIHSFSHRDISEVLISTDVDWGGVKYLPIHLNDVQLHSGQVRDLCRKLSFLHSNIGRPCLHGAGFVHRGSVMLHHDLGLLVPLKGNCNSTTSKVI